MMNNEMNKKYEFDLLEENSEIDIWLLNLQRKQY